MLPSVVAVVAYAALVCASPVNVKIQKATVNGVYDASTGVDKFLGLKYATALRFRRATATTYSKAATIDATSFGVACPQIKGTNALAVDYGIYGTDEDCTVLDVYRPHTIPKGKLLPVMVWLHGGALTQGAASHYPGEEMVRESSKIGLPVITVIINYRLSAWGFLGGKEAAANGALNLGLYDQKSALQWVQDNISAFGGDKKKVTVFGQSSGAMSIAYHMLDVNTKLFRGAILESGTTTSVPAIAPELYQGNYDALVGIVGCPTGPKSFECLRTKDWELIYNATNQMFGQPTVYGSRPWGVSIDGEIIPASPSVRTAQGKIAKIPFITGNVNDEGTIFVKPQTVETSADVLSFLERDYLNRGATFFKNLASIIKLEVFYPNIPALGSPFGTGDTTFFGKQFKRAAAIYGDIHFQYARRNFLDMSVSKGIKSWSYIFNQVTPGTNAWQGVFHTAEIPYVFMKFTPADGTIYTLSQQMLSYWVSFAHNLDPNYHKNPKWDRYSQGRKNIVFTAAKTSMVPDDFRKLGIE
ncbi:Alpha/Beta hydrolase protein [Collybia nuda]|uniref:Carboxylic ester hydrolase n=1 Tax=Collybia nuda TaxID=64659 RepID=A0A9P5Y4D3_9AGAR|nr:Alpha/Beta hydrolase protein [Collybia nuda]